MLKYRVLTAAALLLIILAAMWLLDSPLFACAVVIFFIVAAGEWTALIPIHSLSGRVSYVLLVILALYGAYFLAPLLLLYSALLVWLWAAAAICAYQHDAGLLGWQWPWVKTLTSLVMLTACWKAVILLQAASPVWLLAVFALVWLVDTGAFFPASVGEAMRWPRVLVPKKPGKVFGAAYFYPF